MTRTGHSVEHTINTAPMYSVLVHAAKLLPVHPFINKHAGVCWRIAIPELALGVQRQLK